MITLEELRHLSPGDKVLIVNKWPSGYFNLDGEDRRADISVVRMNKYLGQIVEVFCVEKNPNFGDVICVKDLEDGVAIQNYMWFFTPCMIDSVVFDGPAFEVCPPENIFEFLLGGVL